MAYVGIDLGTTNSCVAVHNDDRTVEIIRHKNGSKAIPSSVTFTDAETLVGFESTNASQKHAHNTVYEAKRLIGQTYDQIKGHLESNMYPFKTLEQGGHPKIQIKRNNQDVLIGPEEVSAEVLKNLRLMAEENLKKPVRKAVITVPAYFMSSQRAATKAAARMAGFETVNIINEPTAAALVYHRNLPENKEAKILVYDFGGGTFDVSIVSIKNKNCKVLGIEGDVHLGGADIDMNLVSFLQQDVMKKHGMKLAGSMALKRLRSLAKEIKENLSTVDEYEVTMSNLCEDYVHTMTRDSFEKLNVEVFRKTLLIVRKCLQNVGLRASDIDDIVLVGGSSRIPKVRAILQTVFRGSNLNDTLDPDEAVAHGAAIYASFLATNVMETTFQDVVSLSLGIETQGDAMSSIIERNMEIPCEATKSYATSEPNQREVPVKIYQGERQIASKNYFLGNFVIKNLTPAPRGATKINVTFSLNSEGILTVTAEEESRGVGNRLVIDMDEHVVQNQDLNERLTESAQKKDEDLRQVQLARTKIKFENFCEDLKASLRGADQESRNYVIEKIDEVVRDNVDVDKMIRMEALLRIPGNEVNDLKNFFKCREIAFNRKFL